MIFVILWIASIIVAVKIARSKGISDFNAALLSFFLGPLGALICYLLPANQAALDAARVAAGEAKRCPECAELVRSEAIKCRYCGHTFEPKPEEAEVSLPEASKPGALYESMKQKL